MISFLTKLIQTGPGPLKYFNAMEAGIAVLLIVFVSTLGFLKASSDSTSLASIKEHLVEKMRLKWAKFRYKNKRDGVLVESEWLNDETRLRHTHVVGATGSGKTVLVEQLIAKDIKRGYGCLIIDAKGERDFYLRIRSLCKKVGREKDLFLLSAGSPSESSIWNPCNLGSASELQSKFFNSSIYDQFHYAKAVEGGLLRAFTTIDFEKAGASFDIKDIASVLKREFKGSSSENLEGLYLDLENLASSEWGKILGVNLSFDDFERSLQLFDVVQNGKILFVDLPTEAKAVQSSRIGRLLLQEIMLISGMRKADPSLNSGSPFCVYVDEFDAFATQSFATFLNKGRSSKFMITIAHQTLSQLDRIGEGFRGEVMGNCNVRFVFRQDEPDDAEKWANFIGTRSTVRQTYRSSGGKQTGESSNRLAEEFIIHPNEIKQLGIGECVYFSKSPRRMRKMKIPYEAQVRVDVNDTHGQVKIVMRAPSSKLTNQNSKNEVSEAMKGL